MTWWLTSRPGSVTSPGPPGPPRPKLSVCSRGFWLELRECMGPPGPPRLELPWRGWCCCCCCGCCGCCCCCWRGLWDGSMRLEWGIYKKRNKKEEKGKSESNISDHGTVGAYRETECVPKSRSFMWWKPWFRVAAVSDMAEGVAGHSVASRNSQAALTLTCSTQGRKAISCFCCRMLLMQLMHVTGVRFFQSSYSSPELHIWILNSLNTGQKINIWYAKILVRGTNSVDLLPVQTWGAPQVSQVSVSHWEGQTGKRGAEDPRKTRPRLESRGRWGNPRSQADWNIPNRLRDKGNKMYSINIQYSS